MSFSATGGHPKPFQYSPLPSSKHIRLLILQRLRRYGDPIYADLEHGDVTGDPKYHALSYSWGMNADSDASFCQSINVRGTMLAITQNLFEGLQRLLSSRDEPSDLEAYSAFRRWQRSMDQELSGWDPNALLRLWVDAVCINQKEPEEQSSQVAMMADIYSKAWGTLIWLGEGQYGDDYQTWLFFHRLSTGNARIPEIGYSRY